ncbi:MAG: hypothetical protein Q7K26_02780 [bacterium]|nr:hypothetical protein [bacterium]
MSSNLDTVLAILKNEVDGDVSAALEKMSNAYSMTWMYHSKDILFPTSKPNVEKEIKEIYSTRGRKYRIKNTAEGENIVMLELIESYLDSETGQLHQTPLVLVLEMVEGKIKTGRHYCDPQLSYENLSEKQLEQGYRNAPDKQIIE